MSLTVAYAALATGIIVWLILVRKLSAKPWEAQAASPNGALAGDEEPRWPAARVGLWVFLAVITSLFGLFVSAYYMRLSGHHGSGPATDWVQLSEPPVLWLNSILLIAASIAMQVSRRLIRTGSVDRSRNALLAGGLLTLAFLGGQFYAWVQVRESEFFSPLNPAVAFFYLLTAVHGLHLLGGLYVWGRTLARTRRPDIEAIDVRLSIELCSVYWHFLLLVWLGLFAVMLST
ncbi:MAG TPA: cytochrome c oxidase subunit 3 [Steroidobacteraceae bacterium]|nr:cytochrome c oxidase subunit 3 [Steroidobacteraceae bacterium]